MSVSKSVVTRTPRSYLPIVLVAAAYLVVTLLVQDAYYQLIITNVLLWATLAVAWNLISGYTGLTSFGHGAFWGVGSYTVALAMYLYDITPFVSIPIAMVLGAILAAVIGIPTFRLGGSYFALAMLAYPLTFMYVVDWLGYQEVALPMKRENAWQFMQFSDQRVYVFVALILLVVAMAISIRVEKSRFGRSLLAIKQNEPAAEAAGIDTWRWKMIAMMISGAMAAAAGGVYALVLLVVTPSTVFGMMVSAQAAILVLFGGIGTFWGPIIGASTLVPMAEVLNAQLGHVLPGIQGVVYGIAIILIIILAPEGVYWEFRDRLRKRNGGEEREVKAADTAESFVTAAAALNGSSLAEPSGKEIMRVNNLSLSFGGLKAVNDVSFTIDPVMIQGIIGPNGAGKTTLFNILNGFLKPDSGTIEFDGHQLVGLKPNQICRLGIGRTFQVVRSFPRMSILENVLTGAFVGTPSDEEAQELAVKALAKVGLLARADVPAAGLTNRELRLMELARALAPNPKLLLIDEMFAGLAHEDIESLLPLLKQLRDDGIAVVIIEHTMDAMVRLVDRILVLDHGSQIAAGRPGDVLSDPKVIEAYLGKRWVSRAKDPVA